jgi:energy-converting hydrogenase Eha subunit A
MLYQFKGGVMELEITWNSALRVWWAYIWRNLIAIIVSMVVGFAIGLAVGFASKYAGISIETIKPVVMIVSGLAGLAISVIPIKIILGKNFGEFRLVLMKN